MSNTLDTDMPYDPELHLLMEHFDRRIEYWQNVVQNSLEHPEHVAVLCQRIAELIKTKKSLRDFLEDTPGQIRF